MSMFILGLNFLCKKHIFFRILCNSTLFYFSLIIVVVVIIIG